MLLDAGASLTIVGHSERRDAQREGDADVRAKAEAALSIGLNVILCIGESLDVRESGQAVGTVLKQLDGSLPQSLEGEGDLAIAYEPIWAIGTGKVPTNPEIAEMHDVTLIHRRDSLRAEKILQDRLFANPNIKVVWDSEVVDFVGGGEPEALVGLDIRNKRTGEISRVDVEGAFVAIGHQPATELFKGQLKLDDEGYILVEPGTTRTNIPGVFACGDVMDFLSVENSTISTKEHWPRHSARAGPLLEPPQLKD